MRTFPGCWLNFRGGVGLIGVGATALIDLWAVFLRRAFSVRSLDYCLLGRWVLHIRRGIVKHDNITAATRQPHECTVGWTTHYLIGTGFALVFVLLASEGWLARPTLLPALAFGAATVVVPFFTMQPSFGLGIAASKTPHPNQTTSGARGESEVVTCSAWRGVVMTCD